MSTIEEEKTLFINNSLGVIQGSVLGLFFFKLEDLYMKMVNKI